MCIYLHCYLARWPGHLASPQNMDVNMEHLLASIFTIIDHYPKPLSQVLLCSNFSGNYQQMTQQLFIGVICLGELRDWLLWNNQNMHWCLGIDVFDSNTLIILMDKFGWDLPANDLRENTVSFRLNRLQSIFSQ